MRIKVTQEHIEQGERQNCLHCPIALALHEGGAPEASVGTCTIGLLQNGDRIDMPDEAIEWIERFDTGLAVAPFEFEINP